MYNENLDLVALSDAELQNLSSLAAKGDEKFQFEN